MGKQKQIGRDESARSRIARSGPHALKTRTKEIARYDDTKTAAAKARTRIDWVSEGRPAARMPVFESIRAGTHTPKPRDKLRDMTGQEVMRSTPPPSPSARCLSIV